MKVLCSMEENQNPLLYGIVSIKSNDRIFSHFPFVSDGSRKNKYQKESGCKFYPWYEYMNYDYGRY